MPASLTFTAANAGTPQTFTYTPSGSASGTITLTASGTGQFTAAHSAACAIAGSIVAGAAFATYVGANQVQLSGGNASGGSGTYSYQWFRSTAAGVPGAALSGAASESFIDTTPAANTDYYYQLVYTDTSTAQTAASSQIHVHTLGAGAIEVIGGVGDSIMGRTSSTGETPFTAMIAQLNVKFAGVKQFVGVDRSISGTTSGDWAGAGVDLPTAAAVFNTAGVTRVVLMLGTNDSKGSVQTSASAYQANIQGAVTYLFANISTLRAVHLFSSPFLADASGDLSVQNCGRLFGYSAALAAIANGSTIYFSEPLASYNLFQKFPAYLSDGIHPGDEGVPTLGGLWAANVAADMTAAASSGAGYSRSSVANA